MGMIGNLLEVFEISGRGCVALVEIQSGSCRIGDDLKIGVRSWPIAGIEMPNYNAEGRRRIAEGWQPPLGLLLQDATKADLTDHLGGTVEVVGEGTLPL